MVTQIKLISTDDDIRISREDVRVLIQALGYSATFKLFLQMADRLPVPDQIRFAYIILLDRDTDENGLQTYSIFLKAGLELQKVLKIVCKSDEYRGCILPAEMDALDNENFVNLVYKRILRRPSDPTGRDYYTELLRNGMDREKVIRSVINSKEGRAIARRRRALRKCLRRHSLITALKKLLSRSTIVRINASLIKGAYAAPSVEGRSTPKAAVSALNNLERLDKLPAKARDIITQAAFGIR